jgi:hypothetical protein
VDKSNLMRLFLVVFLTLTFVGTAQAGQVKEKDLSDVVAPQEEPTAATGPASSQTSAADDAKEGFSSGAKGLGTGFKNGVVATGHGFQWLGGKMGSGLKTAGVSIKNFFTGKYFGFGNKDEVNEGNLKDSEPRAGEAKADFKSNPNNDGDDDLEMDADPKGPKASDWAS